MEIKIDSLLAKYYKWFYGVRSNKLPVDGCVFIKKLILAFFLGIFLFVIDLPRLILGKLKHYPFNDETKIKAGMSNYTLIFLTISVICYVYGLIINHTIVPTSSNYIQSVGFLFTWIILIILIILCILYLCSKIKDYINKSEEKKQESKIYIFYKSIKDKYCFKINWK